MNMTVAVTDLAYGKHVVTVEVLDGTLAVDMVGILGAKHTQKEPDVQPTKRPNVKPTQTPSVQPTVKPTAAPQQTPKADRPNSPKRGTKVNKNIGVYQVTKAATMKKAGTVKLSGLNKKYKKRLLWLYQIRSRLEHINIVLRQLERRRVRALRLPKLLLEKM